MLFVWYSAHVCVCVYLYLCLCVCLSLSVSACVCVSVCLRVYGNVFNGFCIYYSCIYHISGVCCAHLSLHKSKFTVLTCFVQVIGQSLCMPHNKSWIFSSLHTCISSASIRVFTREVYAIIPNLDKNVWIHTKISHVSASYAKVYFTWYLELWV